MADRVRTSVLIHEFVTGGGMAGEPIPPSWQGEGRAMRRALAEDFALCPSADVIMTLDASLPDEPGPWRVVRIGPGEEAETFARLSSSSDHTLCVAPETGGILEERARLIDECGGRSLGSSPEAIALCGDKIRLGRHLQSLGVPTPEARRVNPSRGLPADLAYPVVVKPIDGAGSLSTFRIDAPAPLPPAVNAMTECLAQPFVAGEPLSASFLVTPAGEPVFLGLARQTMTVSEGRLSYQGGSLPEPSAEGCPRLRACLDRVVRSINGLRGWVGIDFIRDESTGTFSILEVNPRVTTSYIGWRAVLQGQAPLARCWMGQPAEILRMPGRHASFHANNAFHVEDAKKRKHR